MIVERLFGGAGVSWGTGLARKLHEEPQIPNYVDRKNENPRLKEGMVLAIEPMVNVGQAGHEDVGRTAGRRSRRTVRSRRISSIVWR